MSYDAWLEQPFQDEQAAGPVELEAWDDYVDRRNRPVLYTNVPTMLLGRSSADHLTSLVPHEACEEDHPDHAIYLAWRELEIAIGVRQERLLIEDELAAMNAIYGCVIDPLVTRDERATGWEVELIRPDGAEYTDEDIHRGDR